MEERGGCGCVVVRDTFHYVVFAVCFFAVGSFGWENAAADWAHVFFADAGTRRSRSIRHGARGKICWKGREVFEVRGTTWVMPPGGFEHG